MRTWLAACVLLGAPLLVISAVAAPASARADEVHDLASDIVARTGANDAVDKVLTLMRTNLIRMVETRCGKSEQDATSTVDDIVMPSVRRTMPLLKTALTDLYVKNYSLDDLRGLDAFYGSTVGQHVISKQPQIMASLFPTLLAIEQAQLAQVVRDKAQQLQQRGVTL